MNTIELTKLLKSTTGKTVYIDFIPEKKPLPAVVYSHIADGFSRVLKGGKSGNWDTWRVLCIGRSRTEIQALKTAIKSLDNTKSDYFSNIFVVAEGNIPARPEDKTRTAFVDIKTYG